MRVAEAERRFEVAGATCSLVLFTVYSLVQTLSGRARFDITLISGPLLALTTICFVAPLVIAIWRTATGTSTTAEKPTQTERVGVRAVEYPTI